MSSIKKSVSKDYDCLDIVLDLYQVLEIENVSLQTELKIALNTISSLQEKIKLLQKGV